MKLRLHILSFLFFVPSFGMQFVPKDVILSKVIPYVSGDTAFKFAMTDSHFYSMLCDNHDKKVLLLSCTIPLKINIHRNALVFYAQQSSNTNDITIKNNSAELVTALMNNENSATRNTRKTILSSFNKIDSVTDTIEFYGRDYSKNKYGTIDISSDILINDDLSAYILRLLFAQKFDPNSGDSESNTLLHTFVKEGKPSHVEYILNHFKTINLNIQNDEGNTPLHCANDYEDAECAKLLIDHFNSDPNIQNNDGNTPLHLFVENGYVECIAFILDSVFDINRSLFADLKSLSSRGKTDINPNIKNNNGSAPIHYAIWDKKILKLLLWHAQADLNIKDSQGRTTIHRLIESRNGNCLRLFLDKSKVDLNIKDLKGRTPIHTAIKVGDIESLELLLDNQADPNIKDLKGMTPIHRAIKSGDIKSLKLLLNKKADPNIKDKSGNSPIHRALWEKKIQCFNLLLKNSATNPNIKDKNRDTPLACVLFCRHHLSDKERIKYIKILLNNPKTKPSMIEKFNIYLLRKAQS